MSDQSENFYIQHTFSLPKTTKLTEEIVQQFDHILDFATPEEYRNTLIEIYHMYINHEHESLPGEFKQMAGQMYFLIDFFRRAEEEMREEKESSQ